MGDHTTGFEENAHHCEWTWKERALHWVDAQGIKQSDEGVCIDLARRGILFDYKRPFALGELIEVTFNPDTTQQNTVKGQVCRCAKCHDQSYT